MAVAKKYNIEKRRPPPEGITGTMSEMDGSSLVAVLVIITIASTLIGTLMLAVIQQGRFIQQDISGLEARYRAEAGVYHFLADTSLPLVTGQDTLLLTLSDSTNANVTSRPFGGFLAVTSHAGAGSNAKMIRTLAGLRPPVDFDRAVVLGDMSSELNITGSTNINGDIEVGPLGIEYSSFKGELFKGSVKGDTIKSNQRPLPDFDNSFISEEIEYCKKLLKATTGDKQRIIEKERIDPAEYDFNQLNTLYKQGDLTIQADSGFKHREPVTIIATDTLVLEGAFRIPTQSRLIAGKQILISGEPEGEHILFYSGKDILADGEPELSAQLFAEEQIVISGSSYLRYPSVVYAIGSLEGDRRRGGVEMSDQAVVDGLVMMPLTEKLVIDDQTKIVVGQGAKVRGAIYNNGKTELHGELQGSALTFQFYFYHSPTSYINWLKDVTIDRTARPDPFVVPLGFSDQQRFELLTWQEVPVSN